MRFADTISRGADESSSPDTEVSSFVQMRVVSVHDLVEIVHVIHELLQIAIGCQYTMISVLDTIDFHYHSSHFLVPTAVKKRIVLLIAIPEPIPSTEHEKKCLE